MRLQLNDMPADGGAPEKTADSKRQLISSGCSTAPRTTVSWSISMATRPKASPRSSPPSAASALPQRRICALRRLRSLRGDFRQERLHFLKHCGYPLPPSSEHYGRAVLLSAELTRRLFASSTASRVLEKNAAKRPAAPAASGPNPRVKAPLKLLGLLRRHALEILLRALPHYADFTCPGRVAVIAFQSAKTSGEAVTQEKGDAREVRCKNELRALRNRAFRNHVWKNAVDPKRLRASQLQRTVGEVPLVG